MRNRSAVLLSLAALGASLWGATSPASSTIQLKDGKSLTGQILAEKKDQLVMDMGYTVLVVPKDQVERVVRPEEAPAEKPKAKAGKGDRSKGANAAPVAAQGQSPAEVRKGLYASATGSLAERSVRDLVAQLGEAVAQVRTPGGLGSGFFLNEEGYLITNFHVIEGETQISIEVYHQSGGQLDRRSYRAVRIIAMNKFADLALLKIEDAGAPKFAHVLLGTTDALAVGERVFAIGSPLGLERTVTEGILSTKTRQMQGDLFLQTTAQINPGNSGGPLFNLRGEVVGVTNMKLTFGEGLGFAIPVERVRYFLDQRDAFAYDNDNPSNAYRYLEPPRRLKQEEADNR